MGRKVVRTGGARGVDNLSRPRLLLVIRRRGDQVRNPAAAYVSGSAMRAGAGDCPDFCRPHAEREEYDRAPNVLLTLRVRYGPVLLTLRVRYRPVLLTLRVRYGPVLLTLRVRYRSAFFAKSVFPPKNGPVADWPCCYNNSGVNALEDSEP